MTIPWSQWARRGLVALFACAVALTLAGCTLFGPSKEERLEANLANQRKAAVKFIQEYPNPDFEKIRFTQEGDRPGLGASWSANAVLTIAGKDYQGILGTFTSAGDALPTVSPGAPRPSVTVVYSDGSQEVLQ